MGHATHFEPGSNRTERSELFVTNETINVDRPNGTGKRIALRLYVAGNAPNSVRAMRNLKAICDDYLPDGDYDLEIVDVLEEPRRALRDGILLTPMLVKLTPPRAWIIGDLSDTHGVLQALRLNGQQHE
jgi:circadian clock protein KaiB